MDVTVAEETPYCSFDLNGICFPEKSRYIYQKVCPVPNIWKFCLILSCKIHGANENSARFPTKKQKGEQ